MVKWSKLPGDETKLNFGENEVSSMNLQSLRTFLIAAENESMTAAADEQLYAQSTVTTQIKQLEAEWGVELFRKQGRGVRLTSEGRAILAKVKGVIKQLDALENIVQGIEKGGAGHIRIGVIEPVGSWLVAPILAEFTRNRPLLQINFETGSMYSILERVERNELETAIVHTPKLQCPLPFEPLYTEKMCLLIREDHELARKETVTLDDLRTVRLILQDTAWGYRGITENYLVYYGRDYPYANLEINSVQAMFAFVKRGIGAALLPDICLNPVPEKCVVRAIEGQDFERTIGIVHGVSRNRQPVLDELLDYLRARLKKM